MNCNYDQISWGGGGGGGDLSFTNLKYNMQSYYRVARCMAMDLYRWPKIIVRSRLIHAAVAINSCIILINNIILYKLRLIVEFEFRNEFKMADRRKSR